MASLCNTGEEFRKMIRNFNAIPLLQITQIDEAFRIAKNELVEKHPENTDIQAFMDYIDDTWMDRNARFRKEICNNCRCYRRTNVRN